MEEIKAFKEWLHSIGGSHTYRAKIEDYPDRYVTKYQIGLFPLVFEEGSDWFNVYFLSDNHNSVLKTRTAVEKYLKGTFI